MARESGTADERGRSGPDRLLPPDRPGGGRPAPGSRIRAALLLLAGLAAAAACESDVQGPAGGGPGALGSMVVTGSIEADSSRAEARTLGAAYDSADGAGVRLVDLDGDSLVVDDVRPFDPSEGTAEIRVQTRVEGDSADFGLELDLRRGEAPLFAASRTVTLRSGATVTAEVSLEPVAAGVRAPGPVTLPTVGDTARVEGAVLFATGDTIPDLAPTWSSLDPGIVSATPEGLLTARAQGQATVVAGFEGAADTLQVTVQQGGAARLEGRVVTAQGGSGVEGVTVSFTAAGAGGSVAPSRAAQVAPVTTAADGTWTSPELEPGTYEVDFEHPERISTTYFGAEATAGRQTSLGQVPLVPTSQQSGGMSGRVVNARDGSVVGGAALELRRGVNATSGPAMATTTADGSGQFFFTETTAGTYTVTAAADGFTEGSATAVIVGGTLVDQQNVTLSPTGAEGEVRIVLTWGETPSDLDAHLTGPDGSGGRFHVYFANQGSLDSSPFAALDVDDTSSFGPETITITQVRDGIYRYSVHDFTNSAATPEAPSSALAQSGARVEVFIGGVKEAEFFPPNQDGTLWTVFELQGTTVTSVDTMGYETDSGAVGSVAPTDGTSAVKEKEDGGGTEKR